MSRRRASERRPPCAGGSVAVLAAVAMAAGALLASLGACAPATPKPTTPGATAGKTSKPGAERPAPPTPEPAAPAAPLPETPAEAAEGRTQVESPPPEPPPATGEDGAADADEVAGDEAPPILLRVGLASDLDSVVLPCCGGDLVAEAGGRAVAIASPIRVTPTAEVGGRATFRLQVAALRDEGQADELARRLVEMTGLPSDAHFDAGVGLYRVRAGRFAGRNEAEAARRRYAGQGLAESWVVSEGGEIRDPSLRLTQGKTTVVVPGRWLAVHRSEGGEDGDGGEEGIRILGKRYRGRILVYLNDRGTLNVIDEVDLEQYLRGVVPSEMGPGIYDRVEALKAQAVAARTYALRNLGGFEREGYDVCATPRCQVYNGVEVEHPLSDRAIAETAGQVLLYHGELVDARYSSTCGGHTEDVGVVFPLENYPYLKGVPCLEAGVDRLAGDLPRGAPFPEALARRLFPSPEPEAPGGGSAKGDDGRTTALGVRLASLAAAAGLPVPADRLESLARREIQRYVASLFDLALDARIFVAPEELPYLIDEPPADWSDEDRRRAAYLLKSGLLTGPPDRPLDDGEIDRLVFRLAELLRLVEEEEGTYRSLEGRRLTVQAGGEERTLDLPPALATFRRRGDSLEAGPLALVPGDGLTWYSAGGRVAAVVQEVDSDGVAYDRTSRWSSWTRFRSDAQLARLVEERYPGVGFSGLEVLSRGVSGRVGKLRVRGTGGRSVDVEGLAVRWTLDLPDTRFTMKRLRPATGAPGYLFTGSGWGHGVGLCQVGAFGMAGRGHTYREILQHYYTGVTLGRVRPGPPARQPAR